MLFFAAICVGCSAEFRFGGRTDGSAPDDVDSSLDVVVDSSRCTKDTDCIVPALHCDTVTGACVACTIDAHCTTPGFPRCDVALHRCVQCGSTADCPSIDACEPITKTCVQKCTSSSSCPLEARTCDTAKGFCVQCKGTGECSGAGAKLICDPNNGRCVECTSDGQCMSPSRPRCDVTQGTCVRCIQTADCPGGKLCDPKTGECV